MKEGEYPVAHLQAIIKTFGKLSPPTDNKGRRTTSHHSYNLTLMAVSSTGEVVHFGVKT